MTSAASHIASDGGQTRWSGFTLIELLVSLAVLVLIVVLIAQFTNNAAMTTSASDKRLDADGQARAVFARMEQDFSMMVKRDDVDVFFVKNGSGNSGSGENDAFYFYSETTGYFSSPDRVDLQSSFSLVGYRIANHGLSGSDAAQFPDGALERLAGGMMYAGVGSTPWRATICHLTYAQPTDDLPNRDSTLPRTHGVFFGSGPTWVGNGMSLASLFNNASVLSDSVFRLEFCFVVKDPAKYGGQRYVVPVAPGASPWALSGFSGKGSNSNNQNISMRQIASDASAIVVTIAVLDPKSRVAVTPQQLVDAAKLLPNGDSPSVAQAWVDVVKGGTLAGSSGLPAPVASQVRVYQRFFFLDQS